MPAKSIPPPNYEPGVQRWGSTRAHWAAQVSVCVHDEAAVIWAGEETPCALGVVCSLGSINQANNAALTAAISELIEPFGVKADRMYLNVCPPRPPRHRATARTAPHRTAPHRTAPQRTAAHRTACLHALPTPCSRYRPSPHLACAWLLLVIPPFPASSRFTRSSSTCRERTAAGPDAPSRAEVRRCQEICDGVELAWEPVCTACVSFKHPHRSAQPRCGKSRVA